MHWAHRLIPTPEMGTKLSGSMHAHQVVKVLVFYCLLLLSKRATRPPVQKNRGISDTTRVKHEAVDVGGGNVETVALLTGSIQTYPEQGQERAQG